MKRKIFLLLLVTGCIAFLDEKDDKMINFLEKIKKELQTYFKKKEERARRKKRDKIIRQQIRKKIIEKLANPFITFNPHKRIIIDTTNRPEAGKKESFDVENKRLISKRVENKPYIPSYMLNPFKPDELKKSLEKIIKDKGKKQEQYNNNIPSSPSNYKLQENYEKELQIWLEEVFSRIQWFWDLVYKIFIVDKKRFGYLEEVICKDEIKTSHKWFNHMLALGWECKDEILSQNRFNIIKLSPPRRGMCTPINPQDHSVDTSALGAIITCVEYEVPTDAISTGCTPLLYSQTVVKESQSGARSKITGISTRYKAGQSLCYNLVALNFFAYENELKKYYSGDYILQKASYFIFYMTFMNKIYKDKIIPAVAKMCYGECICDDLGIKCPIKNQYQQTSEEEIVRVAWALVKREVYEFITLLSKLTQFIGELEKDRVILCDDKLKDELKKILGNKSNFIRMKEKQLIDMKIKIVRKEEEGKIDRVVYEEIIRLMNDVKKELSDVKEAVIKLWDERFIKELIKPTTKPREVLESASCILWGFHEFLTNKTSINNKNVLQLSLHNLIELYKNEVTEIFLKFAKSVTTFDDIMSFSGAIKYIIIHGYDIWQFVKEATSPKIKGLIKIAILNSSGIPLYSPPINHSLDNLFRWLFVFDYSIYQIVALYNSFKCILPPDEFNFDIFLDKLLEEKAPFLKCFIKEKKTLGECSEPYKIIEDLIGEIEITKLADLDTKLEKVTKYNKWEEIPQITVCCDKSEKSCKDVSEDVKKWCNVFTSNTFKKCCNPHNPLPKCPSENSFCYNNPLNMTCFSGRTALNGNGLCFNSAEKLSQLMRIYYNNWQRTILCDVVENYSSFCSDPIKYINGIKDNQNKKVTDELRCECVICSFLRDEKICTQPVFKDYSERLTRENFLKKFGLLEEATEMIRSGFSNIGQCPYK